MADSELEFKWIWTVGLVAGLGCLVLLGLWYFTHKDRSIITDFGRRDGLSSTLNGSRASVGVDPQVSSEDAASEVEG